MKYKINQELLDLIYPVGIIVESSSEISPSELWGGVWEYFGQGKVLRGYSEVSAEYGLGKTGGADKVNLSHSHTVNAHGHAVPSHSHTVDDHRHATRSHTLTADEMPSHPGHVSPWIQSNGQYGQPNQGYYIIGSNNRSSGAAAFDLYMGNEAVPRTESLGGGGRHSHGNTGNSSPGTSGVSLTSSNSSPGTDAKLGEVDTRDSYIVVYRWHRIE